MSDTDGDGVGDFLVGTDDEGPGASPNRAGRAYLFSGASGALLFELSSPNEQAGGRFGRSVAGVPDADGDGFSDLLVGAEGESGSAGRAYLFSGASGALLFELSSPNQQSSGRFGVAVAGVADADGDGRGDLLVGAFTERDIVVGDGRAYLFSGATGALLQELTSPNPEPVGNFGAAVAAVPDADGDGRGDLVVAASREDVGAVTRAGRAYLFSGATGDLLFELSSPNPDPAPGEENFGTDLAGVADVDGDGFGDVLVGAYRDDPGTSPSDAGRAYLFSGATGAVLHELASPNEESSGWFGRNVAGVPDLDNDGLGDLMVGASREDPGSSPTDAGRAYVFSGATGALLFELTSPNEEENGRFGQDVDGVADLNSDGRGDLLVGAFLEDPEAGLTDAGRAYLFSGVRDYDLEATATTSTTVAPGGSFSLAYSVTSNTAAGAVGDLFFTAEQDGETVAQGVVLSGILSAGQTISSVYTQQVPTNAEPGTYAYTLQIGRFPGVTVDAEAFTVVVSDVEPAGTVPEWSVTDVQPWSQEVMEEAVSFRDEAGLPTEATLTATYPNPFSRQTTLAFVLPEAERVRLVVYDMLGREVAILVDGLAEAGRHEASFEAGRLPAGTYLYRFEAGRVAQAGRMTLVR